MIGCYSGCVTFTCNEQLGCYTVITVEGKIEIYCLFV